LILNLAKDNIKYSINTYIKFQQKIISNSSKRLYQIPAKDYIKMLAKDYIKFQQKIISKCLLSLI
jgi:hypothetical protein